MEHMTLETEQLSMKVGSKGAPVISEKLQIMKKKPMKYCMSTYDYRGWLNSGC